MWEDPIVKETREIRDTLAARFNHDPRALGRYLQEQELKNERIRRPASSKTTQSSSPNRG